MKHLAAYLLLVLGGNATPSVCLAFPDLFYAVRLSRPIMSRLFLNLSVSSPTRSSSLPSSRTSRVRTSMSSLLPVLRSSLPSPPLVPPPLPLAPLLLMPPLRRRRRKKRKRKRKRTSVVPLVSSAMMMMIGKSFDSSNLGQILPSLLFLYNTTRRVTKTKYGKV